MGKAIVFFVAMLLMVNQVASCGQRWKSGLCHCWCDDQRTICEHKCSITGHVCQTKCSQLFVDCIRYCDAVVAG